MESKKPSKKVVIIGAGLAGLAAAHTLSTADKNKVLFDIKLLEAKPYPGGRVRSVLLEDGKSYAELGAYSLYYFDDETNLTNFVESRKLASEKSAGTHSELFTDSGIPNIHLLSNGEEIKFSSAKHYEKIFAQIIDELGECYDREDWKYLVRQEWPKKNMTWLQSDGDITSVKDYIEVRYFEAVESSPTFPLPIGCTPRQIYNRMVMYERFMNATELENLDVSSIGESFDPDCEYLQRSSYSEIVAAISNELPSGTLQCSNVVNSIHWTDKAADEDKDTPPITVLCENDQKYEADHVIITTSLGVLKAWAGDDTFSPPLPTEKKDAISAVGMGKGSCFFFEFSAPLMDIDHHVIELFWLEEDLQYLSKYPWAQYLDIFIKQKNSNVYGTWYTEDNARGIEAASDEEKIEGISLVIEKFLKKRMRPTKVIGGAWTSDPHVLGVYSYNARDSDETDRIELSKPISGSTPHQLLFAGEGTHVSLFGTANGAFETGVREAKRLLECV